MGMDMGIVQAGVMREAEGLRGMMVEDMAIAPRSTTTGPELHVILAPSCMFRSSHGSQQGTQRLRSPGWLSLTSGISRYRCYWCYLTAASWQSWFRNEVGPRHMKETKNIRVELPVECNLFRTCGGIVGIEADRAPVIHAEYPCDHAISGEAMPAKPQEQTTSHHN